VLPVIPVLDIAGGQVVHARRGERARYQPICSPLVDGSVPATVARALLDRVPGASALYVADLDALCGKPPQVEVIAQLGLLDHEIWLDAGFADVESAQDVLRALSGRGVRVRPVFGSESLGSALALQAIAAHPGAILSLDLRLGQPLDPAGAWGAPALWPGTLIAMTLDRVGAEGGPDLETFARLRARAPDRRWIGAGGITSADDLARAATAGAAGWLVASALHAGLVDLR
jgi:phosphoribosylformimino-5-aminoimidazole carboxamide ribotide isomerase